LEKKYTDFKDSDIYLGSDSCTGYRSGVYLIFNEEYTSCKTNKTVSMNSIERNHGRATSKWAMHIYIMTGSESCWDDDADMLCLAELMMLIC